MTENTRAKLLSLLSEACELEHALCCSYLYSAFSIKREIGEGIDWRQQQLLRRWASQIYHIAAQEMLHLAQVWNILTAIGGTPYYARPNFPQPARNFPLKVALSLRRFDLHTLERFIYYEHPGHDTGQHVPAPASAAWPLDEDFKYATVGALYRECGRIIASIDSPALFIGSASTQVGQPLIDFYDVITVHDRASALAAIARITLQGEGSGEDRTDSHYGVFQAMRAELGELPDGFSPARPAADNPYLRRRRDQPGYDQRFTGDMANTLVTDPVAILAIDLFDDVYVAMLQALAHVFAGHSDQASLKDVARSALELMVTVIKPLGEAITQLPSGVPGVTAGPAFGMSRHAQLPASAILARQVFSERLMELADRAALLAEKAFSMPLAGAQIRSASGNLARITKQLIGTA